eukprot:5889887-Pleurochrysis_carterae.AAC.3
MDRVVAVVSLAAGNGCMDVTTATAMASASAAAMAERRRRGNIVTGTRYITGIIHDFRLRQQQQNHRKCRNDDHVQVAQSTA